MARTSGTNLRREILDTTRRLLIQDGYQNLSMRKIANAIGYSATSIYLYFENKDNLVHALIDEGMEKMQQLLLGIDNLLTDPLKALRELCNRYVAFGLENPEYYEVMFQLHPARMARYPVEKYRKARKNLEVFRDVIEAGQRMSLFREGDALLKATAVWTSLHGLVSLLIAQRVDQQIAPEDLQERVFDQVVAFVGG
ncbi:MAG TPA: TetR/AcrR family transcriptional regulator [Rhodothermales bacterium]|nr:TetR/AcrR family transcriptional regulator [Rhodothermales bacterium]